MTKKQKKQCAAVDCDRLAITKGLCDMHYRRLRKFGDIYANPRPMHRGPEEVRFHQKYRIAERGCWEWTCQTRANSKGVHYSRFALADGTSISGHRYSWKLHNQKEIPDGGYICHKCDNPICVNPDHLFLSDHLGNMEDMRLKGRSWKGCGVQKASAKLTIEQIAEIRSIVGLSQSKIAKIYGVSQVTIGRLLRGETYKCD